MTWLLTEFNLYILYILMAVLCIDVGLKNLALCIMTNQKEILLWETTNTLDDTAENTCTNTNLDGTVCGKRCGYTYKNNGTTVYSCKRHLPKGAIASPIRLKKVKEYLLQDIAKVVLDAITHFFNKHQPITSRVTKVLIELQPRMNNKMMFTSHLIYGKLVELYATVDRKIPVRFVRASQKLKAYKGPGVICNLKSTYAKRKYLGVEYTKWILQNELSKEQCDKWLGYFLSHSKKDDLADTFLMAINGH